MVIKEVTKGGWKLNKFSRFKDFKFIKGGDCTP